MLICKLGAPSKPRTRSHSEHLRAIEILVSTKRKAEIPLFLGHLRLSLDSRGSGLGGEVWLELLRDGQREGDF